MLSGQAQIGAVLLVPSTQVTNDPKKQARAAMTWAAQKYTDSPYYFFADHNSARLPLRLDVAKKKTRGFFGAESNSFKTTATLPGI